MRYLAVLLVATSVEVAHAEPPRSQLVGGFGVSAGRFYPGDGYYDDETIDGVLPWAYIGWRVRPDLAITVDAWVLNRGATNHWATLAGGAAGVRGEVTSRLQLTGRLGYGHIEWSGNDVQLSYEALVFGVDASLVVLRDSFGAVAIHARIMLMDPSWEKDHFDVPTLLSLGLVVER